MERCINQVQFLRVLYERSSEGNYEFGELNDLALRRLYELAPEEGRRLIIAEMRRPDSRVGLQSFSVLPDETFPELDSVFVDNFEKGGKSMAASQVMKSMLFGLSTRDPATYCGVGVLLVIAGLMACRIPARWAAKVDPMMALRCEWLRPVPPMARRQLPQSATWFIFRDLQSNSPNPQGGLHHACIAIHFVRSYVAYIRLSVWHCDGGRVTNEWNRIAIEAALLG